MKKKSFLSLCFALLFAASAGAAGNSLVIPSASCVSNLNPLLENYREGAIMLNPLYDPLYVKDVSETRFYLAKSYEVSADGTVFTLTLKDGLKWHDGEPITADDVIFTMAVNADTNNGAGNTNAVIVNDQPVAFEKIGRLAVRITLPVASASYSDVLGSLTLIPAHVFGGDTNIVNVPANLKGVGSGPYKLKEFVQDQYLLLSKNEDYYLGAPSIDTVTFRIISDPSAQEVALRGGEINFMELTSAEAVKRYSADPAYRVVKYPEGRVNYLAVNKFCPTVQDRRVVEAVFAALNRDEIVAGAYGEGMAEPANGVLSNVNTFYDPTLKGYDPDPAKARKLADECGLRGKTMTLYFNSERVYMKETAQIIQQELKAIGVTLNVIPLESSGFFKKVFGADGDYEFYLNGYGASGDPDNVVAGMYNGTWGVNLAVSDILLGLWKQARTVYTDAERAELYRRIQQRTREEMPSYPIAYPNYVFVTAANVRGADAIRKTPIFEDYTKLSIE